MGADQDRISQLDRLIAANLEKVSPDLYKDWIIRTARLEPTAQCVAQLNGAAQAYRQSIESFKKFEFKWNGFGLRWPFTVEWPRQRLRAAIGLIEKLAREVSKDVEQARDIVSIIKANDGSCRFYDELGGAIIGLYAHEWPNDRLAPDAEIIATRYLMNQDEVLRYKQDLEAWLTRRLRGCTPDIKQRLGARRL